MSKTYVQAVVYGGKPIKTVDIFSYPHTDKKDKSKKYTIPLYKMKVTVKKGNNVEKKYFSVQRFGVALNYYKNKKLKTIFKVPTYVGLQDAQSYFLKRDNHYLNGSWRFKKNRTYLIHFESNRIIGCIGVRNYKRFEKLLITAFGDEKKYFIVNASGGKRWINNAQPNFSISFIKTKRPSGKPEQGKVNW